MDKAKRKKRRNDRREKKDHNSSARKAFKEDHPSLYGRARLRFGLKYKK
jgi:hypothetical protein